jgi:GT2 family glycosyltransferase
VKLSCVILTMGDRSAELERAVASVHAQREPVEVVVVGNGADVPPLPDPVKIVRLPDNAGVAGGRNAGLRACGGDAVLFLDDDGWYAGPGLAGQVAAAFAADPQLAVLSFRVADPAGGPGARWHVPRLRADPERSSPVTTFAGGACAIRRSAFEQAGGLPEQFFYAHEETDLAWRLIGLGYRLRYDAGAVMFHPALPNKRHPAWYRLDGRNRVLLARRNLPWPLAALYLLDWLVLTVLRERSAAAVWAWLRGFAEGWRVPPGERRMMSARTAWRLTLAGRPPVI